MSLLIVSLFSVHTAAALLIALAVSFFVLLLLLVLVHCLAESALVSGWSGTVLSSPDALQITASGRPQKHAPLTLDAFDSSHTDDAHAGLISEAEDIVKR